MASKSPLLPLLAVVALGLGTWLILRHPPAEVTPVVPDVITNPMPADALIFQTLARTPAGDRAMKDGDTLAPGEKLHFRVRATRPGGHLLIARIDRLGGAHLVYPANRGGRAAPVKPSSDTVDLGQTLDRLAGEEHIVALLCARPFVFDTVRDTLRADRLSEPALPGCAQTSRRLIGGE